MNKYLNFFLIKTCQKSKIYGEVLVKMTIYGKVFAHFFGKIFFQDGKFYNKI